MPRGKAAAVAANVTNIEDAKKATGPKITIIKATLTSIQPMMQHALTEAVMANLPGGLGNVQKPNTSEMEPRDIAKLSLYKGPNGEFGVPSKCLFAALSEAGRFVKFEGKRNISNAEESMLPAFLILDPRLFLMFKNQSQDSWVVDIDSAVNPTTKGRTCVIRPVFPQWELDVEVEVNHAIGVTEEMVRQLFEQAGYRCGFGANRKKAPYGRFHITQWVTRAKVAKAA